LGARCHLVHVGGLRGWVELVVGGPAVVLVVRGGVAGGDLDVVVVGGALLGIVVRVVVGGGLDQLVVHV
jgi:hypothetical protein